MLWPFNRALAQFRDWYAKGAGIVAGMTREDVEESLAARCRFSKQQEGDWMIYRLEPRGVAGMHPLLGFAALDLYLVHVRFDPQTRLALETTRISGD